MRITIRIADDLYRSVKEQAARTGRTIGEVIEDALRRALADEQRHDATEVPPLPTFGGSGTVPGIDLTSNVAVREVMDRDVPVDALR